MLTDDDVPEGFVRFWVPCRTLPSDRAWEVINPADAKQCRWVDGGQRCTAQSVARLDRTWRTSDQRDAKPRWWHYCEDHLYGRRIQDGEIWMQIVAPADSPLAAGGVT